VVDQHLLYLIINDKFRLISLFNIYIMLSFPRTSHECNVCSIRPTQLDHYIIIELINHPCNSAFLNCETGRFEVLIVIYVCDVVPFDRYQHDITSQNSVFIIRIRITDCMLHLYRAMNKIRSQ
jgi:hypothetical protein